MDRKFRSKSIAFKLTIAFVVSLVLQSVLLVSFIGGRGSHGTGRGQPVPYICGKGKGTLGIIWRTR